MSWESNDQEIMEKSEIGVDGGVSDLQEKCRLCLKGTDELMLIPVSDENAVALKIDILTTVKVAPTDKICTVCRLKIKRFYSFRVMCIRSDQRIRHASKDSHVSMLDSPELSLPNDVSVVRVHSDSVYSSKRPGKVKTVSFNLQDKHLNESLSIIPMSQKENGKFNYGTKLGSGLTISPVPPRRHQDEYGNGHVKDQSSHSFSSHNHSDTNGETEKNIQSQDQGESAPEEESESLEVQIDPFMLMAGHSSDPDQASDDVNPHGHMLYPVLGNQRNLSQRPVMPLLAGRGTDRERALELIKQMTSTRKATSMDGSFLDKPFKCDICPESFSYYKSFVKHKQRHSGELQTFKCEFCPDVFPTRCQLHNHLKCHNIEKAFPCDQCERSFPTKERLQAHYTLHTGNKPHVCEICNKSFAYKSSYGLHLRKQHGEQQIKSHSFKCDKCPQEFDVFVDFKRHLRTHTGERPFTCHVCNKSFASKSILNVHSRIHNGFKPYKCEICNQAFTQKQSLDYHMRRHNEENPFKCEHCGLTFQRRHFLDKHMEVQHGIPISNDYTIQLRTNPEQKADGASDTAVDHPDEDDDVEMLEREGDYDSDPLKLEIDVKEEHESSVEAILSD